MLQMATVSLHDHSNSRIENTHLPSAEPGCKRIIKITLRHDKNYKKIDRDKYQLKNNLTGTESVSKVLFLAHLFCI